MNVAAIKQKIEETKAKRQHLLGQLESAHKQLEELTGTDSLKKAKAILNEKLEQLEEDKKQLAKDIEDFEKKYAGFLQ